MGQFFPDEQVQIAIRELNQRFPDVWPRIKDILRSPPEAGDPRVGENVRAFKITFDQLPFIARITDPQDHSLARSNLIFDVMDVARAEFREDSQS